MLVSAEQKKTPVRILLEGLRGHWVMYLTGTAALLVTSISEVLAPKFVQWALDVIAPSSTAAVVPEFFQRDSRTATLAVVVLWLIVVTILGWLGRFFWRQTLARRSHQAGRDLKVGMWEVLRHQPLQTFQRFPLGDLMNRAIGDLHAGRAVHGFTIVLTFDMIFFAVLGVVAMLMIDVELALWSLAVFPFLPRNIIRLARREYVQHEKAQETLSSLSELIAQCLGAIRLQRSTATHGPWTRALDEKAQLYAQRRLEVLRTGLRMFPLGAVPTLIAYGVLLWWGVEKIQAGTISIGEFVALQSYVLLLQTPLFELGDVISEWQRGLASLSRIAEILNLRPSRSNLDPSRSGSTGVSGAAGAANADHASMTAKAEQEILRLQSVSVVFGDRPVLNDVSLVIPRGARIGITGPVGSGKTTLLRVISGLEPAVTGRIELGGRNMAHISRRDLTDLVAVVPQKSFLFAGSIRHNLVLSESFSDEDLWRVLHVTNLDADVRAMPTGLDTWVGEWGINLSGGQKQRMALARALLRPKQLLLMDDCLSAVDAATEAMILDRVHEELADRTIVWVAHRVSTLRLCDMVWRLEDGKLCEVLP
jgi:ATP-binding cassette subfamily B multidrug efflux pump